ncbi:MAG: hypothetical protein L3J02_08820 [Henriciella sp.]|nr:hypothetical protein [Henriciella sp.]
MRMVALIFLALAERHCRSGFSTSPERTYKADRRSFAVPYAWQFDGRCQ